MGTQVVFSFLLPVRGKAVRRRLIMHVCNWLWSWSWQQDFGFYNYRTLFAHQCLLGRDEIVLTKWGKGIFASRMADLVKRHFKLGMTEERELLAAL